MDDLLLLSMLAFGGLLIAVWIVILSIKRYEVAIFLIILSPLISAIFIPNSPGGVELVDSTMGSYLRIGLIMLIGGVGFIKYLRERSLDFEPVPIHFILLGVFCLLALLSTAYSIDRKFTFIRSVTFIPFFCFLLGLNQCFKDQRQLNKILDSIFYAICFYILANIIALPILPARVWWYVDTSRYMGLWSQPNQMGAFCMISYPILLWKISDSDPKMKWFVYFLILVTAIFHILSGSRTTLLASAFGICIWLLVLKKPIKFVLMIFMVTALAMLAVSFRPSNLTREGGFESVSTFTGRTEIWIAALTLAKEKPIVGYGYGVGGKIFEDPRFYDPKQELWSGSAKVSLHNGYLSAVIGMGILGILLLYGLLFLPFSRARKTIKGEYRALMITVIFMCLLTNFLESVIGGSSGLVSIILWILWVIAGKFPAINKADFSYGY